MRRAFPAGLLLMLLTVAALGQAAAPPRAPDGPLTKQVKEMLQRAENGHSPTLDEASPAAPHDAPQPEATPPDATPPDAKDVRQAVPLLVKALGNKDRMVRAYALTVIESLRAQVVNTEAVPAATPETSAATSAAAPATPAEGTIASADSAAAKLNGPRGSAAGTQGFLHAFAPETAKALAPAIPLIAARLADDNADDRALAATILGGFTPDPPPSIYPPLLAFLKRDDAAGTTGQAVFTDLLELGPLDATTSAAMVKYVSRADQTAESRSNLVDAVSTHQNQSQTLNQALLRFLDSDDASLRARLILSLPQLDLAPEVFADTKSRIGVIASANQDSLPVVNAAKAVLPCWTSVRMVSGCPVY